MMYILDRKAAGHRLPQILENGAPEIIKLLQKKRFLIKNCFRETCIFFSGSRNGRYKNITHIEIYTGGAKDVSASSRYGKVVHYGYGKGNSVVLVARPTK